MYSRFRTLFSALCITALYTGAVAQTTSPNPKSPIFAAVIPDTIGFMTDTTTVEIEPLLIDREDFDSIISVPQRNYRTLDAGHFGPVVFDTYHFLEPIPLTPKHDETFPEVYYWLDDLEFGQQLMEQTRQRYATYNPDGVRYNLAFLPETPKSYRAYVDPTTTKIVLEELKVDKEELAKDLTPDIERKKWLQSFDASLQFSQAYVSPNWYQGGNNNLNLIGQLMYHVKLNQKFYPKYLFEATVQYKLALTSTPDDSIHSMNITEDIFQVNATFGVKAAKRWFYSANLMFKTQLFNSYPLNSRQLQSSFLSPGELNLGLGMTYNYSNAKKTFTFGASISPLSWNMKTCIDRKLDETVYGITEGHKTVHKVGSSAECTLQWKIAYNIVYNSRLFAFTDYGYFQADWEHTVDFNINRFLSTRLYVDMRYDTTTPRVDDSRWHKFQLKEIFSFGFAYHFGVK